jgi:hypothetical protein
VEVSKGNKKTLVEVIDSLPPDVPEEAIEDIARWFYQSDFKRAGSEPPPIS